MKPSTSRHGQSAAVLESDAPSNLVCRKHNGSVKLTPEIPTSQAVPGFVVAVHRALSMGLLLRHHSTNP